MAQETVKKPQVRTLPREGRVTGADDILLERGRIGKAGGRIERVRASNWSLKVTAAMTGVLLALFVTIHMVGNLKVYSGPESFNAYAHWLRVVGDPLLPEMGLLWIVRIVMGTALILHIWSTLLVRYRGFKLRGGGSKARLHGGSFISRLMLTTGLILMVFVVFHILDLTTGQANSDFQAPTATESFAYENLINSFSNPLFASIYMVSMVALAFHLVHGLWVLATDLGVTALRTRTVWKAVAHLLALVVALVNLSIPAAVLMGVVS